MLQRLRSDLLSARKAGADIEVSMIRTLISAVENAGAIDATKSAEPLVGLHHDRPRRQLDHADIVAILEQERAELAAAAATYRRLGLDGVEELEQRIEVVDRYLH